MRGDLKTFLADSDVVFMAKKGDSNPLDYIKLISALFVLFLPLFATVYLKSRVIAQGYVISKLQRKVQMLEERRSELFSVWLTLKSPENLEKLAKQLGFKKPGPQNLIVLKVERKREVRPTERSIFDRIRDFLAKKIDFEKTASISR